LVSKNKRVQGKEFLTKYHEPASEAKFVNNEYGVIELTILIEREFSKSGSEGTGTHKGNRRRMLICVMQGVFSQFPETRSCPITFYVLDGLGVTSQTFLVIDGSFTILVVDGCDSRKVGRCHAFLIAATACVGSYAFGPLYQSDTACFKGTLALSLL